MTRILYIGDPSSVHDIKWVSYFSVRTDFEAYFLVQEHEMNLITPERLRLFTELNITVVGPIKSYSVWRIWENRDSIRRIFDVIRERKIDIIHPLFATPFALWTTSVSIPSVITTRGSDIMVVLSGIKDRKGLNGIHGSILFNRFRKAFLRASAVTCTSEGQAERINTLFNCRIPSHIIRTGVNVAEIAALEPSLELPSDFMDRKTIFLPRYIRPIYRTEMQLDAIRDLPPELKNKASLLLVKGARTEDTYLSLIQRKLAGIVMPYHVFDSLSQPEMWSAFKMSSLAIMTPRTDGTPNSALEAMAAKCPLIMGSFDYDPDLFSEDSCLRMTTDSSEELTDLIRSAFHKYPENMLNRAFDNVGVRGNRPTEMERLNKLYLSLTET